MTRLEAASLVDTLDADRCWHLATALDDLRVALSVVAGPEYPHRDRLVAAAKERVIALLASEDATEPMGTVGRGRPR